MSRQRIFLKATVEALLALLVCIAFLPTGAVQAAAPYTSFPAKHISYRVNTPRLLPMTDAQQRAVLIQRFGEKAKHFKIVPYADSWTDTSQKWTSYQTGYSATWAGYIADVLPTPYYAYHVQANFTVPSVNTGGKPSISEWAGIGGYYGNDNLIQAGVATDLHNGKPAISAFFETYPNPPIYLWLMSPGENMTVGINVINNANGQWQIFLVDSSGTSQVDTVTNFYPDENTAEWIQERSPDSLNPSPIPSNAAPVYFTTATWGDQNSGTSRSIQDGEVGVVRRELLRNAPPRGNNECLVPYNLYSTNGSSSFNTVWQSSC